MPWPGERHAVRPGKRKRKKKEKRKKKGIATTYYVLTDTTLQPRCLYRGANLPRIIPQGWSRPITTTAAATFQTSQEKESLPVPRPKSWNIQHEGWTLFDETRNLGKTGVPALHRVPVEQHTSNHPPHVELALAKDVVDFSWIRWCLGGAGGGGRFSYGGRESTRRWWGGSLPGGVVKVVCTLCKGSVRRPDLSRIRD